MQTAIFELIRHLQKRRIYQVNDGVEKMQSDKRVNHKQGIEVDHGRVRSTTVGYLGVQEMFADGLKRSAMDREE